MSLDIDPDTNIDKNSGVYIEPPGLGVSWLWLGREDHIFYWAAVKHDMRYTQRAAGLSVGLLFENSKYVDAQFEEDCRKIIASRMNNCSISEWLKLEVIQTIDIPMFYGIVRAVGEARWPKIEADPVKRKVRLDEYISLLEKLHNAGVM